MTLEVPSDGLVPEDMEQDRVLTIIDLEQERQRTPTAKIVNNSTLVSKKLSDDFVRSVYSNIDGDIGFVPSCQCGNLTGVARRGLTCPICGTVCSSQFVDTLTHQAWLGIPTSYPAVLHPVWYMVLRKWTNIGKSKTEASIIDLILDVDSVLPPDLEPFIHGRGFKYFYEHADEIIEALATKYPRTMKKPSTPSILAFHKHYRKCMFTRYLPILHNSLHPLKGNGSTLKYSDNTSKDILTAVVDLSMITFRTHAVRTTQKQLDKTMYGIYQKVISYYTLLIDEKLGKKQALLRKHDFGSRTHFSARTVVTPHDHVLPMDEVILPWKMIVNSLKLQIINVLINREKMSMDDALTKFIEALVRYDPDIERIIRTIISEFDGGRLPIALGRNPTLAYGSIMKLYVREFRTDPNDETMSINACIVKPANIDFDGDELYLIVLLTKKLADSMNAVHPSKLLLDVSAPGLSSRIGLLQQNWVTLESYMEDDEDDSSFCKELS